jgi:formylmethanofuran dehydrogenase subunit E
MKIGEEGDTRKYQRPRHGDYYVSKNAYESPSSWPRCAVCKDDIRGKKWRVAEGKYVCTRCHNETV